MIMIASTLIICFFQHDLNHNKQTMDYKYLMQYELNFEHDLCNFSNSIHDGNDTD